MTNQTRETIHAERMGFLARAARRQQQVIQALASAASTQTTLLNRLTTEGDDESMTGIFDAADAARIFEAALGGCHQKAKWLADMAESGVRDLEATATSGGRKSK